ncbi:MAG: tetratricopeptide repeat protein [Nitrospira sp.]|nr:tetratricopeptide repeat protein [Nitrospira sp.]
MTRSPFRSGSVALCCCLAAVLLLACQDRRADKAYLKGNYEKSAKELESLANLGDARAQYNLGLLYDQGLGVPQSDALALRWYTQAAEHGEPRAQYNLGIMYMNGQGTTPDPVLAYYWFSLAVAQGESKAPAARDYVMGQMSSEQISQGQQMVMTRLQAQTGAHQPRSGSPP